MSSPVCSKRIPKALRQCLKSRSQQSLPLWFLYETATIRHVVPHLSLHSRKYSTPPLSETYKGGHSSTGQDQSRQKGYRSFRPEQDDPVQWQPVNTASEQSPTHRRIATITGPEREILERLYRQPGTRESRVREKSSKDLDRAWNVNADLNKILAEGVELWQANRQTNRLRRGPQYQWPRSEEELQEEGRLKDKEEADVPRMTKADIIRTEQERHYQRIEKLITSAKTDAELWNVLEKEIFSVIRTLGLGGEQERRKKALEALESENATLADFSSMRSSIRPSDLAIWGSNYPSLLVVAVRQLRHEFPASSLPLAILPAMKALGRESFALGASTILYNEIIVFIWLKYADYQTIINLLQEMDTGMVDFDSNTLEIVRSIQNHVRLADRGLYGPTIKAIWSMNIYKRGTRELRNWEDVIASSLSKGRS
jgi:hypothetical protein